MKLTDIKVKYTHPAMIENIKPDTEYMITEEKNELFINKVKFTIEEIKAFFSPVNCKWDEFESDTKKLKPTK